MVRSGWGNVHPGSSGSDRSTEEGRGLFVNR